MSMEEKQNSLISQDSNIVFPKKEAEEALEFPEVLILEDINNEEEVKQINKQKETKDTKSTLTFGK